MLFSTDLPYVFIRKMMYTKKVPKWTFFKGWYSDFFWGSVIYG